MRWYACVSVSGIMSGERSPFHLLASQMRTSSKSSAPSIHRIRVQVRVTLLLGTKEPLFKWSVFGHTGGMPSHMAAVLQIVSKAGSRLV
jgi:acid phosphatase family membrane protein YuiD